MKRSRAQQRAHKGLVVTRTGGAGEEKSGDTHAAPNEGREQHRGDTAPGTAREEKFGEFASGGIATPGAHRVAHDRRVLVPHEGMQLAVLGHPHGQSALPATLAHDQCPHAPSLDARQRGSLSSRRSGPALLQAACLACA